MTRYNDLIVELDNISELTKKFPESLQGKVFDIVIKTYLSENNLLFKESVDIKEELSEVANSDSNGTINNNITSDVKTDVTVKKESKKNTGTKKSTGTKWTPSQIPDLDLSNKTNPVSLKDFLTRYKMKSDVEFNAVVVYYLQHICKIPNITIDHLFTCYKQAPRKVPTNLRSSIGNTANRNKYISHNNFQNITMTTIGENKVEFELIIQGDDIGTE